MVQAPGGFFSYQPLLKTFFGERLNERGAEEIRRLHRAAAIQFLDDKDIPPAARYHARLAGDSQIYDRALRSMVEFCFARGDYSTLRATLDDVAPAARWMDAIFAVYQGRLYEHENNLDSALTWYEHAKTLFDKEGPDFWRIGITNDIGGILRRKGRSTEALALYDGALAKLDPDAPVHERGGLLVNRSNVLLELESLPEAERGYLEAKAIFELHKDAGGLCRVHQGLGYVSQERGEENQAFIHRARAFRWARRSADRSLVFPSAMPLAENLLALGRVKAAHRVYASALSSMEIAGPPRELPFLLSNFGLTCANLAEPDAGGVPALFAALEMKRALKISTVGTLQNLGTLLIRLGDFEGAFPIIQQQEEAARAQRDEELERDAHEKIEILKSKDRITDPKLWRLKVEGRLRASLRRRPPLVFDLIDDMPESSVILGPDTYLLRDARPVLLLLSSDRVLEAVETVRPMTVDNVLLEIVWEPALRHSQMTLAALWCVRTPESCWIQAFLGDESGFGMQMGSAFSFDLETNSWLPAEHAEGCDCGHPEAHEEMRSYAFTLLNILVTQEMTQTVVVNKRSCTALPALE